MKLKLTLAVEARTPPASGPPVPMLQAAAALAEVGTEAMVFRIWDAIW